jgi:ABC-type transport system substrate-binding protein
MTATTSIVGAGLAVALLVGGCSGEGEGPTTTTSPSTTTTTTTVEPTTTLDPVAAEEAAVSEAAEQARLARSDALINFDDPAVLAALEQYYVVGPALDEVNESIEVLRTEGWRAREHPTIPEGLTVEEITFIDGPPPTRAEVVVCILDSGVIYEPAAAPDGGDVIVNDQVVAARTTYEMIKVEGGWKLRSLVGGEEFEGVTECPAEQ